MAGGTLLGVKISRRDTKHVVTLNANAMQHGLPGRGSLVRGRLVFWGWCLGLSAFVCHVLILTHTGGAFNTCRAPVSG